MRSADKAAFNILLDPTDPRYITGSEEDREAARRDWHRQRFIGQVMNSQLEEIPRASLVFHRFGTVEDTATGNFYRVRRDGLTDLEYVTNAAAYYCDDAGTPILLELPPGPKTPPSSNSSTQPESNGATRRSPSPPGRPDERHRPAEARPAPVIVERAAATRTITATLLVRTASMSGAATGTAASSLACGPIARSAGRSPTTACCSATTSRRSRRRRIARPRGARERRPRTFRAFVGHGPGGY